MSVKRHQTQGQRSQVVGLTTALLGLSLAFGPACRGGGAAASSGRRVIVLGFDGLDYELTKALMSEGRLPHFARLAEEGSFSRLGTSIPPQSPVAWSNFITGMDAGGHGIFDFIHRDLETMLPEFSMAKTEEGGSSVKLGKWQFPLSGGAVKLMRKGQPFWEVLEAKGIQTTIIRIPVNFPPSGSATRELSGMGTPDLIGTYGTFSFYTTELFAFAGEDISGGEVYELDIYDNVLEAKLYGPDNPFLVKREKVTADFTVYLDPDEPVAKIAVGDEERILAEGEWSDWVPVDFELIPTQSLKGMCRFYLQQVRPDLKLYATPINLDPFDPALPISSPTSYAAELAEETGRFYTQGMPEDTQSLSQGVLSREEFLAQTKIASEEYVRQYKYVLDKFDEGLLFYYFGNVDQVSHMMWRARDPDHPAYDPEKDAPFAHVIENLYEGLDDIVGHTLEHMGDDTTLVVMSDHGFASWRRSFSVNTWLKENGFLAVRDPNLENDPGMFVNVDWSRTRAYSVGFNAVYINLRGREKSGIVDPRDREALMEEIAEKLLAIIDPATGKAAVTKVYRREEVYEHREELEGGPDLIIGYAKGTRADNNSALGAVGPEVFSDNTDEWSGDHLMDHEVVPGVLLTNRPLRRSAPRIQDLPRAILAEFGIEDQFPSRK
ncbi:MAG: alkaline phosphatase family protein [Acidobacteriota bacterium]